MEDNVKFVILSNPRRRRIIEVLINVGGEASLREVVRRIALTEVEDPDKRLLKSIYTGLLQNHIPKMQEMGVVKYNSINDTLRLTDNCRDIRYYLEAVDRRDLPWCYYYLVMSIFSLSVNLYLFTISGFWVGNYFGVIFSVLLFISALYHTFKTKYSFALSWHRKNDDKNEGGYSG